MSKIKIQDINEALASSGWKCISTDEEYQNLDSELLFICDEGHNVYSSWKKIRAHQKCPICEKNIYKNMSKNAPIKKQGRRILALDQSTKITGYAVFEGDKLISYGTYVTNANDQGERISELKMWLCSMIEKWQPDEVGLEGIQYQPEVGVVTFETLARLQGGLMLSLTEWKIPYRICPTNTWRANCKVKGRTRIEKKRSMRFIIKDKYDVSVTEDEADAVGIGMYMVNTYVPKFKKAF